MYDLINSNISCKHIKSADENLSHLIDTILKILLRHLVMSCYQTLMPEFYT